MRRKKYILNLLKNIDYYRYIKMYTTDINIIAVLRLKYTIFFIRNYFKGKGSSYKKIVSDP